MAENLVPFNQTCLLWKSKRKATRLMPLHQTCQLKLWNLSRQDYCYVVNARYMPAGPVRLRCYVAAAATNMYSGLVYLPQTPLLFKHAYWLSDVQDGCLLDRCHSINMPADLLSLNQYACQSFTTQAVCLSIFYHSFLHACVVVVYLYLPYLRVWCLTVSLACWC